jgi:hypothetical protein
MRIFYYVNGPKAIRMHYCKWYPLHTTQPLKFFVVFEQNWAVGGTIFLKKLNVRNKEENCWI